MQKLNNNFVKYFYNPWSILSKELTDSHHKTIVTLYTHNMDHGKVSRSSNFPFIDNLKRYACASKQKGLVQSNFAIMNFLVSLKLFLNAKSSLSL